jgi:dihydrofolate reductase
MDQLSKHIKPEEELIVIGGANLYAQMLPLASRLYLTRIHATFTGDAYFPKWNANDWEMIENQLHPAGELATFPIEFITLQKINT